MRQFNEITAALAASTPWLQSFVNDINIDAAMLAVAQRVVSDQNIFKYDICQFDTLIASTVDLLNRCLAYRKEFYDVASSAVRQALEYNQFKLQRDTSKELEESPWLYSMHNLESHGQAAAAKAFAGGSSALSAGFAKTATSAHHVSAKAADGESTRLHLVRTRWEMVSKYQEDLEARHTQPGHPLNFSERALRLKVFILEDFEEAVTKILSAIDGLNAIFQLNIQTPPEWTSSATPLDAFILWLRMYIRNIERLTQNDFLITATGAVGADKFGLAVVPLNMFQFDNQDIPITPKYVRVRAIWAYLLQAHEHPSPMDPNATCRVLIHPGSREVVTLNDVTLRIPSSTDYYRGKEIYNTQIYPMLESRATNWAASVSFTGNIDFNAIVACRICVQFVAQRR